MAIRKKIEKMKTVLFFMILANICLIFLCFLFLIKHINHLTVTHAFKDFNSSSKYSLYLEKDRNCKRQKQNLFTIENVHFYGYCIKSITIYYNHAYLPLKETLEKKYLTFDELLKDATVINRDSLIKKYQKNAYTITVYPLYPDYTEVIFSSMTRDYVLN